MHNTIASWMLYRFVLASVFGILSVILFSFSFLLQNAVQLSLNTTYHNEVSSGVNTKFFNSPLSLVLGFIFIFIGFYSISGSLLDRFSSGHTNEHWSRYITFSFFEVNGMLLLITRWSKYVFKLLRSRLIFIQSTDYNQL